MSKHLNINRTHSEVNSTAFISSQSILTRAAASRAQPHELPFIVALPLETQINLGKKFMAIHSGDLCVAVYHAQFAIASEKSNILTMTVVLIIVLINGPSRPLALDLVLTNILQRTSRARLMFTKETMQSKAALLLVHLWSMWSRMREFSTPPNRCIEV